MQKCKCKRCDHTWIPRTENPILCPFCKSKYWNDERNDERNDEKEETDEV